jgi:hypothetical protein
VNLTVSLRRKNRFVGYERRLHPNRLSYCILRAWWLAQRNVRQMLKQSAEGRRTTSEETENRRI